MLQKHNLAAAAATAAAASAVLLFIRRRRRKQSQQVQVAIIGDAFADVLVSGIAAMPVWGADVVVDAPIALHAGGSGLNTATQMTSLFGEGSCVLHTALGGDGFGCFLREHADRNGVVMRNMARAQKGEAKTGACVVLSGAQDRAFVTHRGAVADFSIDHLAMEEVLASAHVHIAGYYNAPALWPGVPALLARARAAGRTTSVNAQFDATEQWRGFDATMLQHVDVLLLSEDEAIAISRKQTAEDAAMALRRAGARIVVVTRGAEGAIAYGEDIDEGGADDVLVRQRCVLPAAGIVDTTGAGDAFNAGFLHIWCHSGSLRKALRWGCACGSACVGRLGASAPLSMDEVRQVLV